MNMDHASKQTTEPKEASWRPLKTAALGAAYGAIAAIIIDALIVGWGLSNDRPVFGDKQIRLLIGFIAGMLLWGAAVGLFCAKLPKRFGKGMRFFWALLACAAGFLLPNIMDSSGRIQDGVSVFGVLGGGMALMFALIGQFVEPPSKAPSQNQDTGKA